VQRAGALAPSKNAHMNKRRASCVGKDTLSVAEAAPFDAGATLLIKAEVHHAELAVREEAPAGAAVRVRPALAAPNLMKRRGLEHWKSGAAASRIIGESAVVEPEQVRVTSNHDEVGHVELDELRGQQRQREGELDY
jgi:hypothetical protein